MENYIGDWYYFADKFTNQVDLINDLRVIRDVPEEFDFSYEDAIEIAAKILEVDAHIIKALIAWELKRV